MQRHGVCQDFTHLFIGIARALGIPARYVSGLVHPEDAGVRGASQTHAWCELLFPSVGWVALDQEPSALDVVGMLAVLAGVAPRIVLPASWALRREIDAQTLDLPEQVSGRSPARGDARG